MGNRAKRREAAQAIKAYGIPSKLYKGRARNARKRLNSATLNSILYLLQFKPGMIVSDYGHNHVIKGWVPRAQFQFFIPEYSNKIRRGYVFDVPQFEYEDGYWSCGCGACPDPARTREEMEADWLAIPEKDIEEQRRLGWWTERADRIVAHIRAGGHIHDERGVLLEEWKKP
jgi:hypothetical protein